MFNFPSYQLGLFLYFTTSVAQRFAQWAVDEEVPGSISGWTDFVNDLFYFIFWSGCSGTVPRIALLLIVMKFHSLRPGKWCGGPEIIIITQ